MEITTPYGSVDVVQVGDGSGTTLYGAWVGATQIGSIRPHGNDSYEGLRADGSYCLSGSVASAAEWLQEQALTVAQRRHLEFLDQLGV